MMEIFKHYTINLIFLLRIFELITYCRWSPRIKQALNTLQIRNTKILVIFSDFINLLLIALDKWTHTESDGSSSFQRR